MKRGFCSDSLRYPEKSAPGALLHLSRDRAWATKAIAGVLSALDVARAICGFVEAEARLEGTHTTSP